MSGDEKAISTLLGATVEERASIVRWNSFIVTEIGVAAFDVILQLMNLHPYNKKVYDEAMTKFEAYAEYMEARLTEYTYLATENITVADLFGAAALSPGFTTFLGSEWRSKHKAFTRWFKTVTGSPALKEAFTGFEAIDQPLAHLPPKKEKKAEKLKKEQQPKAAKPAEAASEEPDSEKKAKHPLEGLGRSTFVLDDWKRKYSNEDTRPVALPWFWENYNPEEYSIWKVEYKYNDELTLTFMSNNLVGGFINRLSGSIKYMFGCLIVYGENNANGIVGAVMIRGQEFEPAFNIAPDWESYAFTKLDTTNEEEKEFINNMWAWDKPYEGKEIVDGKVLK